MSIKSTIKSLLRIPFLKAPVNASLVLPSVSKQRSSVDSIILAEKPNVTGLGPFAATPSFTALGHPSRLLNITLPAKSLVNVSDGVLVAIDGDLNALESSRHMLAKGFEFSKIYCLSPASLLINGHNQSYCVVPILRTDTWTIIKGSAVISWSGRTLLLHEENTADQKQKESISFKSSGEGNIVLSGHDQIYEMEVESGKEVRINAQSLIATNATSILVGESPQHHIALTSRVWRNVAASHTYRQIVGLVMQHMRRPLDALRKRTANLLQKVASRTSQRPVMYTVRGPGRVLLDNTQ